MFRDAVFATGATLTGVRCDSSAAFLGARFAGAEVTAGSVGTFIRSNGIECHNALSLSAIPDELVAAVSEATARLAGSHIVGGEQVEEHTAQVVADHSAPSTGYSHA
jgi:hypothetical protein